MHSMMKSADSAVAGEKPNPRMPSSVGSMDRGTFEPQLSGAVDVFPIVKAVGTITQEITPRTGETSTPTEVSVSVSVPVSVPVPVPAQHNETEETRLTERLVIAVKRLDYLAVCGLLNEASMHGLRLDLGGLAEHGGSSLIQLAVEALRELDPHKAPDQMHSTNPTIPCGAIVMELSQHMSFNQLNNENHRRECVVHQLLGLGHARMAHHILEMKRLRQNRKLGHAHVWQQTSTAGVVVEIFGKDNDRPDYTKYHSIGAIRQAWIVPEMPWAFARGEDFKVDPNFQPIPLHHGSTWFREFTGRTQRVTASPTVKTADTAANKKRRNRKKRQQQQQQQQNPSTSGPAPSTEAPVAEPALVQDQVQDQVQDAEPASLGVEDELKEQIRSLKEALAAQEAESLRLVASKQEIIDSLSKQLDESMRLVTSLREEISKADKAVEDAGCDTPIAAAATASPLKRASSSTDDEAIEAPTASPLKRKEIVHDQTESVIGGLSWQQHQPGAQELQRLQVIARMYANDSYDGSVDIEWCD